MSSTIATNYSHNVIINDISAILNDIVANINSKIDILNAKNVIFFDINVPIC